MTHERDDDGPTGAVRLPRDAGGSEALRVARAQVTDLLARHEDQRAVERDRSEMLDRIEARLQASSTRSLGELRRDLHEADRRWRAKRDALRARAHPPSVPMRVPQPPPVVRPPPATRTGGWWDDPVAAEVIAMVDGAPLADERDVRRVRVEVARRLNHGGPGHEDYEPLVASVNALLDDALERIRAGIPDELPNG